MPRKCENEAIRKRREDLSLTPNAQYWGVNFEDGEEKKVKIYNTDKVRFNECSFIRSEQTIMDV
jgi:hypothetical protein